MTTSPTHPADAQPNQSSFSQSKPLISIKVEVSCKKRAIESVADLISSHSTLNLCDVFDSMNQRERLGSTAIGEGVALPHGRLKECTQAVGAIIILKDGIDFDAPDKKPVDIVFGLVVPEDSCDEHLMLLRSIAEIASDPTALHILRSTDAPALYQWLNNRNSDLAKILTCN